MKNIHRIGFIGTTALLGIGCTMLPIQNTPISSKGSLQITLDEASRQTQSRMEDVDHVLLTLQSSKAADATRSIAYVNGLPTVASATFANLWPGDATISATAYGANPIYTQGLHTQSLLQVIGSSTTTATVVASQVTQVPISLKLAPTQIQAGGLGADINLQTGDENLLTMPYHVTTFAGNTTGGSSDGHGTAATFNGPRGVATDGAGNIYTAEFWGGRIRKITPNGDVTTLAGNDLIASENANGTAASFFNPCVLTIDKNGAIYVAQSGHPLIRKIAPNGDVSTVAGNPTPGTTNANGTAASFNAPNGIAVDQAGNLYVADSGNHMIRKISTTGDVTTLAGHPSSGSNNGMGTAASFSTPNGIAVDNAGNVYVADYDNHMIRKITPAGEVTTLAGSTTQGRSDGQGTAASFKLPYAVTLDTAGNLYVADHGNHLVRKITPGGWVSTLAGNGNYGIDNGTGTNTTFSYPTGIAIDTLRNIYVSDQGHSIIRKLSY